MSTYSASYSDGEIIYSRRPRGNLIGELPLGCFPDRFPGSGDEFDAGKPNEKRPGMPDRRFWEMPDAKIIGTLSGPALLIHRNDAKTRKELMEGGVLI